MKLTKCYISAFGKLKDLSVDFLDGLNTFKEENGWGKSTLTVFIKSMFYGLDDSKHNVAENERKKFKPWDYSGRFGGSLEFERDGKLFRIERYFGTKSSEDTVKLFDVETGKEYSKTEDLGKRIFEIDEEGFFSTTYFSQKDFTAKSNSSITAKFNALSQPDDEDAFEKAFAKIENKAKLYKYRGDKGLITDIKRERFELETKLRQAQSAEQASANLKIEIKSLEENAENLKARIIELNDRMEKTAKSEAIAVKKQRYEECLARKTACQKTINESDAVLNGLAPDENEINLRVTCYKDYTEAVNRKNALSESVNALKQASVPAPKTSGIKKLGVPLALLSVVLIGGGIGLSFVNLLAGIITASVGALALAFSVYALLTGNKTQVNDGYLERISAMEQELNGYSEIVTTYGKALDEFLSRFNLPSVDFLTAVSIIKDKISEKKRATTELESLEKLIAQYSTDADVNSKTIALQVGTADIKKIIDNDRRVYDEKINEIARKRASINYYEDLSSAIPDLENKLSELSEKIINYEKEYKILTLALEHLKLADENLKIKYRSPLEEGFNKYLSMIVGKPFGRARIDVDLKVTVDERGESMDTGYYSKGYRNLFEICKRFALIDVLYTKEKPFIILDDPFTNLDDEKLKEMLSFIKQLSKDYQILYFVCHDSRKV